MKYLKFKFYSKTLKYRSTFAVITKDFFKQFPIYEMEKGCLNEIDLAIPKREGLYVVVFGRNDRKVVFCINGIFYHYTAYTEPLFADTEKPINPIIYVKNCFLSEKGEIEKQYEIQFKELIESNQRLVYKGSLRQRLLFMKREKKVKICKNR
jgi:hypothetical protein